MPKALLQEPENLSDRNPEVDMKAALAAMPKRLVNIPSDPRTNERANLSPVSVIINGYPTNIQRNQLVEVSEEVYVVLVRGGHIPAQRSEDVSQQPNYNPMNGKNE